MRRHRVTHTLLEGTQNGAEALENSALSFHQIGTYRETQQLHLLRPER